MAYLDYDPEDDIDFKFLVYFCGNITPHEKHDDEGTAMGSYFIHTCPGVPEEFSSEEFYPSKRHGQFTATPYHERRHDELCPCMRENNEDREVDNDCVE